MKRNSLLQRILARILPLPLLIAAAIVTAQDPEPSLDLNLLRAPVSPAATLLGTSEGQVERPSDPAAFMASVKQATGNFSTLPLNYAVDLAPAWVFRGDRITIGDFLSEKPGKSLPQSFVVSLATSTGPDSLGSDMPRFAAGVKTSVFRGKVSKETLDQIDHLHVLLAEATVLFDSIFEQRLDANPHYNHLDSVQRAIMRDSSYDFATRRKNAEPYLLEMRIISAGLEKALADSLTLEENALMAAIEDMRIVRHGFKLDLAAAMSWDFPGGSFSNGSLSQFSCWASGGWEGTKGLSVLALVRYMYFRQMFVEPVLPDELPPPFDHVSAFDAGLRMIYAYSRLMVSFEALARIFPGEPQSVVETDQGWRWTLHAAYEVGRNKKLGFSVGRDFNQNYYYDAGDLILGLDLLLGFGTRKAL